MITEVWNNLSLIYTDIVFFVWYRTDIRYHDEFAFSIYELVFYWVTVQGELERVEEEQTFQELQSLRQIVYDWFQKEEELAEVLCKTDRMSTVIRLLAWKKLAHHWVLLGIVRRSCPSRTYESPPLSLRPVLLLHPSLRAGAQGWSSTCTPGFQVGGAGTAMHRTLMALRKNSSLVLRPGIFLVRNRHEPWCD